MRKILLTGIEIICMFMMVMLFSACTNQAGPPQESLSGAQQVTKLTIDIPLNSQGRTVEQQQIIDRIAVTNDPTKVMWIHLIALDGKIINRMPVSRKVTSSGKRLEPLQAAPRYTGQVHAGYPEFGNHSTTEFLEADGTFGSSDNYIYWFDPQHRYHQWGTAGGLGYLLTDYPIDLANPQDLITGMYNADDAAAKWQALQEAQLCKAEGKQIVGGKCK